MDKIKYTSEQLDIQALKMEVQSVRNIMDQMNNRNDILQNTITTLKNNLKFGDQVNGVCSAELYKRIVRLEDVTGIVNGE